MSAGRIGRVRMKAGGADVRVLPSHTPSDMQKGLLDQARHASTRKPIVAFALVAMFDDYSFYCAARTDFAADFPMNRHTFVGMVGEAVRDELITYETAREIVNKSNGYDE